MSDEKQLTPKEIQRRNMRRVSKEIFKPGATITPEVTSPKGRWRTQQVGFRIHEELLKDVDSVAEFYGEGRSNMLRLLISLGIQQVANIDCFISHDDLKLLVKTLQEELGEIKAHVEKLENKAQVMENIL